VLEAPIRADFALVRAWKGDTAGNLVYRARREISIRDGNGRPRDDCEVEHLVAPGDIDPNHVVTPGIFVKHVVQGVL